jgi:hypothetical protein
MWTFTKRNKFETLDDLWTAWAEFNRLADKRFRGRWIYVSVPEQHADGTWHMHAGVRGFFMANTLRFLWHKALGSPGLMRGADSPGNVDAKEFRGSGPRAIAAYISKYVGKGFGAVATHRRLFSSSVGICPLDQRVFHFRDWMTFPDMAKAVAALLESMFPGNDWRCRWFGEEGRQCFVVEREGG